MAFSIDVPTDASNQPPAAKGFSIPVPGGNAASPPVSGLRTALDKGLQGASYGFSDEIMDSIGARIASHYTGEPYSEMYKQAREMSKSRMQQEQEQHPIISGASELAGAIALPGAAEAKALGAAGKVAGKVLPRAMQLGKGASNVVKGVVGGAGGGAAMGAGTAEEGQRMKGAESGAQSGALTGGLVSGGMEGIGKAIAPKFEGAVKTLRDAGVLMTPGQMSKGFGKWAEDVSTHLPVVGNVIKSGNKKSMESFNTAVLNKALAPIGEKMPKNIPVGRKSIAHAESVIGKKYDQIMPNLSLRADQKLTKDSQQFAQTTLKTIPEAQRKQFADLLDSLREQHMDASGLITGKGFKDMESQLTYEANSYSKSQDPAQRAYGRAIKSYQDILRDNLQRQNPKYAKELSKINESYAMFKRAQGASIRRVGSQGVFTPTDLAADIKKRAGHASFARGDAQLQDLADAGMEVLPNKIPDSGTAGRLSAVDWLAGVVPGAAISPIYSRPGMRAAGKLATPSPTRDLMRQAVQGANPAVASAAGAQAGRQPLPNSQ